MIGLSTRPVAPGRQAPPIPEEIIEWACGTGGLAGCSRRLGGAYRTSSFHRAGMTTGRNVTSHSIDSDTAVHMLRKGGGYVAMRLAAARAGSVHISSISIAELTFGA